MSETGSGSPAGGWTSFLETVGIGAPNLSLWGKAEQLGVDYGTFVAASYAESADLAEQSQINTFVGFGNLYRGIVNLGVTNVFAPENCQGGAYCQAWTVPMYAIHPTYSQGFVRGFSRRVINPISTSSHGFMQAVRNQHYFQAPVP